MKEKPNTKPYEHKKGFNPSRARRELLIKVLCGKLSGHEYSFGKTLGGQNQSFDKTFSLIPQDGLNIVTKSFDKILNLKKQLTGLPTRNLKRSLLKFERREYERKLMSLFTFDQLYSIFKKVNDESIKTKYSEGTKLLLSYPNRILSLFALKLNKISREQSLIDKNRFVEHRKKKEKLEENTSIIAVASKRVEMLQKYHDLGGKIEFTGPFDYDLGDMKSGLVEEIKIIDNIIHLSYLFNGKIETDKAPLGLAFAPDFSLHCLPPT